MADRSLEQRMDGFRDNAARHRYELDASEGQSWADYRDVDGVRVILHVETPFAARGNTEGDPG